jgi:hypothetical protein
LLASDRTSQLSIESVGRMCVRESFTFNRLLNASVLAGECQHCRTRTAWPQIRRSRRDFKKHAFPMAEERWSVAVAGVIQRIRA